MALSYDFSEGKGIAEAAKRIVSDLISKPTEGVAAMEAVKAFGDALEIYQNNSHNNTGGYKSRRQDLIDAFKALPKDVREALSVPGDVALYAQDHIVRGADHASRPGKDGGIVASFSMDKETAKNFPLGQNAKGDGYFYTLRDVENYEGIFSVAKANLLRNELNNQLLLGGSNSKPLPSIKTFWSMAPAVGEGEFLVYGIKWDKSVDTPAWKEKHRNASKKDYGTAQQIKALGD